MIPVCVGKACEAQRAGEDLDLELERAFMEPVRQVHLVSLKIGGYSGT